ncbi:ABC transporter ATP-binding protein/permease [Flavobacteriaceae bacterium]|nr:ABC transporter ATP-binding protein/permease [Flavobacteriaceae bacterium]
MFQIYLGIRMYLIYGLGVIASILEGLGILMLLPLLQTIDAGSDIDKNEGIINQILYGLIDALGMPVSITSTLILISAAFILKGVITFMSLGFTAFLLGQLLREIKMKLFSLYSNMSFGYFSSKNTGDLINLINEQPTKALEAFKQLSLLGSHFINTVILMSLAFLMTFSFGVMALLLGIFLLILFLRMNSYVQNLSRIAAKENGTLTKWLIQSLHGFKYLISTNQISSLKNYINASIQILTNTQIKSGIAAAFTQSVREPIAVLFIMIIVFIQIFVFELRLEPILVSIALFYRSLNSTLAIQSAFQGTFQTIGSMEIVHNEFINQEINRQKDGNIILNTFKDEILFKNVEFNYDNNKKPVLESISIIIPSKSSIAIVGGSGAGKTSLVDLITLTNHPNKGDLLIDGVSHNQIKKSTWRNQIGYVSQDTIIFDDTIANNISMWQSETSNENLQKKLKFAAKQANILEFIESLPDSFNTIVGDRGILLSGGQKQRIFIARELYRKPTLLILDEATSALDSESEKSIQDSVDLLKGKITVIIIAHRLSTIKSVDKIFLLENGKMIESGSYSELINNHNSQFTKFAKLQVL